MTTQMIYFESKDPEIKKILEDILKLIKSRQDTNRAPDGLFSKLAWNLTWPLSKLVLNFFENIFGSPTKSKDKKAE